jgi:hypothetical protein
MMFQSLNRKSFNALVLLICAYIVFSNIHFRVGNFLSFDIFGYYLYLPLQFIYGDLGVSNEQVFTEVIQRNLEPFVFYQGHRTETGLMVMKYTMGQSILYAPFFLLGHIISWFTHHPSDGFSAPYEYSVFAGGIFYTLVGVYFFTKVLLHFFEEKLALVVLILVVFGTNYLLQNTMYFQNGMTHNTLFACYALILWLTIKWHENQTWKSLIPLAIVCGLAVLIRPTEIVCLFLPLLWNVWNKESFKAKIRLIRNKKIQVVSFSLILFFIVSLQLIYFKVITGSFFYSDYSGNAGEGLDLFAPYTWEVLFNFRKGWLIYTPIMIFSLLGFFSLYKRNKAIFYALLAYFVVNLWFVSSWTCWWYAESFGQRALIPSYAILGITLGYFFLGLKESTKFAKIATGLLVLFFLGLNIFQMIQYHRGIIPGDRMTAAYYFRTFGALERDPNAQKLLMTNMTELRENRTIDLSTYHKTKEFNQRFESLKDNFSPKARSGKKSERMSETHPFSLSASKEYGQISKKQHLWLRVSAYVYSDIDFKEQEIHLVTFMDHKGKPYLYETLNSKTLDLEKGKWNKITYNYLTPPIRRNFNKVKAYLWFRGGKEILVDDLKVEVFEEKK